MLNIFSSRHHTCTCICIARYVLSPVRLSVRPSVRPSVTQVDQSKTVEVRIIHFHRTVVPSLYFILFLIQPLGCNIINKVELISLVF